jgi:hypothetical protein
VTRWSEWPSEDVAEWVRNGWNTAAVRPSDKEWISAWGKLNHLSGRYDATEDKIVNIGIRLQMRWDRVQVWRLEKESRQNGPRGIARQDQGDGNGHN